MTQAKIADKKPKNPVPQVGQLWLYKGNQLGGTHIRLGGGWRPIFEIESITNGACTLRQYNGPRKRTYGTHQGEFNRDRPTWLAITSGYRLSNFSRRSLWTHLQD